MYKSNYFKITQDKSNQKINLSLKLKFVKIEEKMNNIKNESPNSLSNLLKAFNENKIIFLEYFFTILYLHPRPK